MDAFAKVEDLEKRWRELTSAETARAEVLLSDASALIRAQSICIDDKDEQQQETLRIVTCSMVKRAMMMPVDQAPINSTQITVGPFSGTQNFTNPMGELYLTSAEKKMLGVGKQSIGSIRPIIRGGGSRVHW